MERLAGRPGNFPVGLLSRRGCLTMGSGAR